MQNVLRWLMVLAVVFGLSACGGGGGASPDKPDDKPDDNNTPVVKLTHADMSIKIENGSMQEIPFVVKPQIEGLQEGDHVEWIMDEEVFSGSDGKKLTKEGTHYLLAHVQSDDGEDYTFTHEVVGYTSKKLISFHTQTNRDVESYVYSDMNSSLSGASVIIPRGALDTDKEITINEISAPHIPNTENMGSISHILSMEPSGTVFKKPIEITIPYEGDIDPATIYIARYNKDGKIDFLRPARVDTNKHLVTFFTTHFTKFELKQRWYTLDLVDKKIEDQPVIKDITELTEISLKTYTKEQWEDLLNVRIIDSKVDFTVYDLYLQFKIMDDARKKFVAGEYKNGIKMLYPDTKSGLERQIDIVKKIVDAIDIIGTMTSFDPKNIIHGGANTAKEILSIAGSYLGIPTSISEYSNVNRYIPDPVDMLSNAFGKIDDTFYGFMIADIEKLSDNEVMEYNFCSDDSLLPFMSHETCPESTAKKGLITASMVKNLKLAYLRNRHFTKYRQEMIDNLRYVIETVVKSELKAVHITVFDKEHTPTSNIQEKYGPRIKICPQGYQLSSYLSKHPRITFSYQGKELGTIRDFTQDTENIWWDTSLDPFDDKKTKCFYSTGLISSLKTEGNYKLDWLYADDIGTQQNGKYDLVVYDTMHDDVSRYRLSNINMEPQEGECNFDLIPLDRDGEELRTAYSLEWEIDGQTHTGDCVKIDKMGERLNGDLDHFNVTFLPLKNVERTVKKRTVELNMPKIVANSNLFQHTKIDVWDKHTVTGYVDENVKPLDIDFDGDGIWDKDIRKIEVNREEDYEHNVAYYRFKIALPDTPGTYKPCFRVKHALVSDRAMTVCAEHSVTLSGTEDDDTVDHDQFPPHIYINGDNPVTLNVNQEYEDKGAYALDKVDGDVEIESAGTVIDTSKAGVHWVTYFAQDRAGNSSTEKRKVVVKSAEDKKKYDYKTISLPVSTKPMDRCRSFHATGCEADAQAGQTYTKSWTFENLGNVDLTGLKVNVLDTDAQVSTRITEELPDTIPVGGSGTVTMEITVPDGATPGIHKGNFKITDAKGDVPYATTGNTAYFWYMFDLPENLPEVTLRDVSVEQPFYTFSATVPEALGSDYTMKVSLDDNSGGWLEPVDMVHADKEDKSFAVALKVTTPGERQYRVAIFRDNQRVSGWVVGDYSVGNISSVPQNLRVSVTQDGVLLEWDSVNGVSTYTPYFSLSENGNYRWLINNDGDNHSTSNTSYFIDANRFMDNQVWYLSVAAGADGEMSQSVNIVWRETVDLYEKYLTGKTLFVKKKTTNAIYKFTFNETLTELTVAHEDDSDPKTIVIDRDKYGLSVGEAPNQRHWIIDKVEEDYLLIKDVNITESGDASKANFVLHLYFKKSVIIPQTDVEKAVIGKTFYNTLVYECKDGDTVYTSEYQYLENYTILFTMYTNGARGNTSSNYRYHIDNGDLIVNYIDNEGNEQQLMELTPTAITEEYVETTGGIKWWYSKSAAEASPQSIQPDPFCQDE